MAETEYDMVLEAYLEMAGRANYRPEAPSDAVGNIQLTEQEIADPLRLSAEAESYARRFIYEENSSAFHIGVGELRTNRAFVYTIEAARSLREFGPELARAFVYTIEAARSLREFGPELALKLLEMAAAEVRETVKQQAQQGASQKERLH